MQKNGMALSGNGLTTNVSNCTVPGQGATDVTAQNGIQIGFGAGGTIDNCAITGFIYTGATWTASGLLLLETSVPIISTNVDIDQCQTSVYFSNANGTFDSGTIVNPYGDALYAYSSGALRSDANKPRVYPQPIEEIVSTKDERSPVDVTVSNSIITGADIVDSWGPAGYAVGPVTFSVANCEVSHWDWGVVAYDAGGGITSTVNYCKLYDNLSYGLFTNDVDILDAEHNYWGTINCPAITASISGDVDFEPYCNDDFSDCSFTCDVTIVWVDDDWTGSSDGQDLGYGKYYNYNAFDIIMDGITAVTDYGTVNVAAGIYHNDITAGYWDNGNWVYTNKIDKSITLIGAQADVDPAGSTDERTGGESILTRDEGLPYPIVAPDVVINGFMNGSDSPNTGGRFIVGDDADNIEIKYCIIQNTPSGSSGHGVYIYPGAVNAGISYNTIANTAWEGIRNDGNAIISYNTIKDIASNKGIMFGGSSSGSISNNTISNTFYEGIAAFASASITDNDISGGYHGVQIRGNATTYTIDGNNIHDNQYHGIEIPNYSEEVVAGATITNNTFTDNPYCGVKVGGNTDGSGYHINNNTFVGNGIYGVESNTTADVDAEDNWWGSYCGPYHPTANPHGEGDAISDNVDFDPWCNDDFTDCTFSLSDPPAVVWVDDNYTATGYNDGHLWCYDAFDNIQSGLTAVADGGTINVLMGTYTEVGQIVIDKDVTIIGENKLTTIITPTDNTGDSGDSRGWFLVQSDVTFNLSNVTLDGSGYDIHQAVRSHGAGTINNNIIQNMAFSQYIGFGVVNFANMTISNNTFTNIGRVAVISFGSDVTDAVISGNTFVGKGDGDWLDYSIEMGGGAAATISDNTITNCTGIAEVDGSTSAGILITTYFGAGTSADITGNDVSNSTAGIAVGYDAADATVASVTDGNLIHKNDTGIGASDSPAISLTVNGNAIYGNTDFGISAGADVSVDAESNWWGDASGPALGVLASGHAGAGFVQPSDMSGDNTKQLAQPDVKSGLVNVKGEKGSDPGLITYGSGDAVTSNIDYSPWWGDNYVGDPHTSPWNWHVDTNNNSTIQEGIDAASTDDIVNVTSETYTENIALNKAITLLGADRTTTIIDGSANITAGATFSGFTVGSAAQGVFISGEDVIVDDCHIEITAPSAMNIVQIYPANGACNVTIRNSIIKAQDNSSFPAGIYWETGAIAEGFLLEGCTITSNYGVTNNWGSDGTIIRDNTFIQIAGGTEYAIGLKTPITNALIENNVINGFEFGIRIDNSLTALGDGPIIIMENQISNSDNEEIKLKRGKGIEVYGNTLTGDPSNPCIMIYNDYTDLEIIGINGNSILGPNSLQNDRTEIIDATENHWGTLNCPAITASISGDVDFEPYCNDDFSDCSFTCDVNVVWVDDDWTGSSDGQDLGGGKYYNYNAFAVIQDGVNAVVDGGVVHVADGIYREQVKIEAKGLDLSGAGIGISIIEAVEVVDRSSYEITQWNNSTKTIDACVGVVDAGTVNISGFTVDGRDLGPNDFYGIHYFNTGGTVTSCRIEDITYTDSPGLSLIVSLIATHGEEQSAAIEFSDNEIPNFQKGGILTMGPGISFTIDNNIVEGQINPNLAPNGIQVSYGSFGSLSGNEVSMVGYPGDDWAGTGILLFESGDVTVTGGTVIGCEMGINHSQWNWIYIPSVTPTVIVDGVDMDENQWSVSTHLADDVVNLDLEVKNCNINNSLYTGINLWGSDEDPWGGSYYSGWTNGTLNASIHDNHITNSNGDAVRENIELADGNTVNCTAIKNNYSGYTGYGVYNNFSNMINATQCYWGTSAGPTALRNGGNREYIKTISVPFSPLKDEFPINASFAYRQSTDDGLALDEVTALVDYSPWWGDNYVWDNHSSSWEWYIDKSNSSSIQEGIDLAIDDDIIFATPAVYAGPGNKEIDFSGKNLILTSTEGIDNTIIDCESSGRAFHFHNGENEKARIIGFTIKNGSVEGNGGGFLFENLSSPTITSCLIVNNQSTNGGACYIDGTNPVFVNNTISKNGAVGSFDSNGGGIYCYNSSPIIMNTIFWDNTATGDGSQLYGGTPVIIYCDIEGGWPGAYNIDDNPLFRDPLNGNFHLMATACGDPFDSPCIDMGNPIIEDAILDCAHGLGADRSDMGVYGGAIFIDAYEYLPGDASMYNYAWEPVIDIGDILYLVANLEGNYALSPSCNLDGFYASADATGNCVIDIGDVLRIVDDLGGGMQITWCGDDIDDPMFYPPAWLNGPLPEDPPEGWPNCETPVINNRVIPTGSAK